MISSKRSHSLYLQAGFTLLELLFAMAIVLMIVVAAQRYTAGVLTDREHLSAQQGQTSQINVVLSNMQNDVARAGFIPVASMNQWTEGQLNTELKNVGVDVRCVDTQCKNKELWTSYWTNEKIAYDCVHNEVKTARTSGWVRVENIYRFQKINNVWVLGCDGNGGNGGWEGFTNPTEGDIEDFSWTLDSNAAVNGAKLLQFCVTTRTNKNNQVAGGSVPQSCQTGEILSDDAWAYQTIQLDMLVRPSQVGVAP